MFENFNKSCYYCRLHIVPANSHCYLSDIVKVKKCEVIRFLRYITLYGISQEEKVLFIAELELYFLSIEKEKKL